MEIQENAFDLWKIVSLNCLPMIPGCIDAKLREIRRLRPSGICLCFYQCDAPRRLRLSREIGAQSQDDCRELPDGQALRGVEHKPSFLSVRKLHPQKRWRSSTTSSPIMKKCSVSVQPLSLSPRTSRSEQT